LLKYMPVPLVRPLIAGLFIATKDLTRKVLGNPTDDGLSSVGQG
jgi:hypothetical protein